MKSSQYHLQPVFSAGAESLTPAIEHSFDSSLAQELALLLSSKTICGVGNDIGKYVEYLTGQGLDCIGYDRRLFDSDASQGDWRPRTAPWSSGEARFDAVIYFEITDQKQRYFDLKLLDGVASATNLIVVGLAISEKEGDGTFMAPINVSATYELWKRGFRVEPVASNMLRANCSSELFKRTLMVFSKRTSAYTLVERRILIKMIGAEIERLKSANRNNSAISRALLGKAVRALALANNRFSRLFNRLRLLRYDANLARGSRSLSRVSERFAGDTQFFPVCFTCAKHFRFVRLALLSLGRCAPPIAQINLYVDKGDPFSDAQREQLAKESCYPIIFRSTRYPMSSWGPKVQLSELEAYREVAGRMSAGDYMMKFDSDVLFLSDRIFKFVADSKAGAVGTPVSKLHTSEQQEDYMQGGCYFIGATQLSAIVAIPVTETSTAPTKWGEIPEDQFFSALLRRCGVRPVYNDFLYFEPIFIASGTEKSELEVRLKAIPETADVLHFEGNKFDKVDRTNMRVVAEQLFGPLPPVLNPYIELKLN